MINYSQDAEIGALVTSALQTLQGLELKTGDPTAASKILERVETSAAGFRSPPTGKRPEIDLESLTRPPSSLTGPNNKNTAFIFAGAASALDVASVVGQAAGMGQLSGSAFAAMEQVITEDLRVTKTQTAVSAASQILAGTGAMAGMSASVAAVANPAPSVIATARSPAEVAAQIKALPSNVDKVVLVNHGFAGGTYIPGAGAFEAKSPEMQAVYGSLKGTNVNSVISAQCYGASCGQVAADESGVPFTASDKRTTGPNSSNNGIHNAPFLQVIPELGGTVTTFSPRRQTLGPSMK